MFFYQLESRPSRIHGTGLFTREAIAVGAIIAALDANHSFMSEQEYLRARRSDDELIVRSAARFVGRYFVYDKVLTDDIFMNHSANPNMIYHCGMLFARRDITADEELTVDYRYFLSPRDVGFTDIETGQHVVGLEAEAAFLGSCRELAQLYGEVAFDEPRYSDYIEK